MTGAQLQAWRQRYGVSRATLAQICGVTTRQVGRWEGTVQRHQAPVPRLVEILCDLWQHEAIARHLRRKYGAETEGR